MYMDNLNLVSKKGLYGSISVLIEIITGFENGLIFDSIYLCEPQLGKRDLYPHIKKRSYKYRYKIYDKRARIL